MKSQMYLLSGVIADSSVLLATPAARAQLLALKAARREVPVTAGRSTMNSVLYRLLAGLALVIGCAGVASADSKCSNVNIQVTNEYRDPVKNAEVKIKVVDFKYWDKEDNKWRNEVTDNKRIGFGDTATWNKNLAYVGGEPGVKVKVYYKYSQPGSGGANWSAKYSKLSSAFKCTDGDAVKITVN